MQEEGQKKIQVRKENQKEQQNLKTINAGIQAQNTDIRKDLTQVYKKQNQAKAPKTIDERIKYAKIKVEKQQYEEALVQYDLVMMQEPNNLQALINKSLCHYLMHNYQEAIFLNTQAIQQISQIRTIEKRNEWYYKLVKRRGNCFMDLKQWDEALQNFKICIIYYKNVDEQFLKIINLMKKCKEEINKKSRYEEL